jgi:hypothetical protein
MDPAWCYLCRVDGFGVDPRLLWGIAVDDELEDRRSSEAPMSLELHGYLRFLGEEFGEAFDPTLSEGESAIVIGSYLSEPATEPQRTTLAWLAERCGIAVEEGLSYGVARMKIRRMVAMRGLRSSA